MKLSELFDQLTAGEFSQISLGGINNYGIDECDYPKVIPHINLGLSELYKRFPLRVEEVFIQQYEQLQKYQLSVRYAQSNTESKEPIKYIMDSPYDPFLGNVLKIESVANEGGETLFLNDSTEPWSIFTSAFDTINTPYPMEWNVLAVKYRANHPDIPNVGVDPSTFEIDIPPSLLEALLFYVASRVYTNMNTDGGVTDGNNFMQKFELSCRKEIELNLINKDVPIFNRIADNGWV